MLLTNDRIAEIRERCEKADRGPWFVDYDLNPPVGNRQEANRSFCAHARTDLPDALETIDDLKRQLAEAKDRIVKAAERLEGEAREKGHV